VTSRDLPKAESHYRQALAADDNHGGSLVGLASCLFVKKQYSLAEETVKKVIFMGHLGDNILYNRATKLVQKCVSVQNGMHRPASRWNKATKAWKRGGEAFGMETAASAVRRAPGAAVGSMGGIAALLAGKPVPTEEGEEVQDSSSVSSDPTSSDDSGTEDGSEYDPETGATAQERFVLAQQNAAEKTARIKAADAVAAKRKRDSRGSRSSGGLKGSMSQDQRQAAVGGETGALAVETTSEKGAELVVEWQEENRGCYDLCMSPYMIHAYHETLQWWDIAGILLVLYTAIMAPYEVAFLESSYNVLFAINRAIDGFFTADMLLQFFIKPIDEHGRAINEPSRVAREYTTGWFSVDLVAVIPFDLIAMLSGSEDASNLKIVRVMRVLRLVKLARILRTSRLIIRLENTYAINYALVSVSTYAVFVFVSAHWMACGYYFFYQLELGERNWVSTFYGRSAGVNDGLSNAALYQAATYFSVQTISSIGFGDVGPQTTGERLYVTVSMFFGAIVFAFALGTISTAMTAMYLKEEAYCKLMDDANAYIQEIDLEYEMAIEVRVFFKSRHKSGSLTSPKNVLDLLSPHLREAVAMFTHRKWVKTMPFFTGCSDKFVVSIAQVLKLRTFAPMEVIYGAGLTAERMYIVRRGLVGVKGAPVGDGKAFGSDVLRRLVYEPVVRTHKATCLTYVECYSLEYTELKALLNRTPSARLTVLSKAVYHIFIEHIQAFAQACRAYATNTMGMATNPIVKEMEDELLARNHGVRGKKDQPYRGLVRKHYADELLAMKAVLSDIGGTITRLEERHRKAKRDKRAMQRGSYDMIHKGPPPLEEQGSKGGKGGQGASSPSIKKKPPSFNDRAMAAASHRSPAGEGGGFGFNTEDEGGTRLVNPLLQSPVSIGARIPLNRRRESIHSTRDSRPAAPSQGFTFNE